MTEPEQGDDVADRASRYRCYSMAGSGHILGMKMVVCIDEGSARRLAAKMLQTDAQACSVELWEVGRLIARLRR
jgi:hypothetical protein